MCVADMDFKAPPAVLDALHEAVEHGVFGYPGGATDLDAVTGWQVRRFGWDVPEKGSCRPLRSSSSPGDSILIQPPVYAPFHGDIRLNGRHLTYAR